MSIVTALHALQDKEYMQKVKDVDRINILLALEELYKDDTCTDSKRAKVTQKAIARLVAEADEVENNTEFRHRIAHEKRLSVLNRMRNRSIKDENETRLRYIHARMCEVASGQTVKKRVPGSGTKVTKTFQYKPTKANIQAGREGEYTREVWENAEYTYVPRKIRKRRIKFQNEEKKRRAPNQWLKAMELAKAELNAPAFCIVRKQSDDPNDVGVKVYLRAKKIMQEAKESQAGEEAN